MSRTEEKVELTPVKLPKLGNTEKSVMKFFRALAIAQMNAQIHPRIAENLIRNGRAHLDAIKQRNTRAEFEDLQKLLKDAEDVTQKKKQRIAEKRHSLDA